MMAISYASSCIVCGFTAATELSLSYRQRSASQFNKFIFDYHSVTLLPQVTVPLATLQLLLLLLLLVVALCQYCYYQQRLHAQLVQFDRCDRYQCNCQE
jgi:hypothetical protein